MRLSSRVVWNEGMHLAQHHFQAQSRYIEDAVAFALSHLFFESYGLLGFELDADALRNGTVSLVHARGVMPDGLAFSFPEGDALPAPREIADLFSPTVDQHLVLLSIPPYRRGQPNCALGPNDRDDGVRYVAEPTPVLDDTTGQDEKPVNLGRKNFRLILDQEQSEDGEAVSLPVARVRRDGTGHFVYDPEYIPPVLQIGASPRLLTILHRLVEMLDAKSAAIIRERQTSRKPLAEYAAHEVANFWLSHAVHSSLAPLRHDLQTRRAHPEQLYAELARLAGALCTFSLDADPNTLPLYRHDRLDECFNALDRHIRTHLDVIIPTNCLEIPLERTAEFLFTGAAADKRAFGKGARWYLGVRSSAGEAAIMGKVPGLVKVCSAEHIVRLVKEAHAGLALTYVPTPPSALSPRIGTHYFSVDLSGPCGQLMEMTGGVGIYVPAAIKSPELDLLVVLES